jgi:UDP-N-acetylmuramate dehydrogenase
MSVNRESITCQSGATLKDLVNLATENSLSGLEFAAGIPGTVGGGIRGNAGAFSKSMGNLLTKSVILTENEGLQEVEGDYFDFGYRESKLKQTNDIVLSATFRLSEQSQQDIKNRIEANLSKRMERIPWHSKSAGCFFKNVDGPQGRIPAGFLLDQIGAKGIREGDAEVSSRHANFLVNAGSAKASDVKKLARKLKEKVKQKFNIELHEEVVYIN